MNIDTHKATYIEQIITRHARLARNTGGDDDEITARQGFLESFVGLGRPTARGREASDDLGLGRKLQVKRKK